MNSENSLTRYYDFIYDGHICFTFIEQINSFYSRHLTDNINYNHIDMRDNTKYQNILRIAERLVKTVKIEKISERKDAIMEDFAV